MIYICRSTEMFQKYYFPNLDYQIVWCVCLTVIDISGNDRFF